MPAKRISNCFLVVQLHRPTRQHIAVFLGLCGRNTARPFSRLDLLERIRHFLQRIRQLARPFGGIHQGIAVIMPGHRAGGDRHTHSAQDRKKAHELGFELFRHQAAGLQKPRAFHGQHPHGVDARHQTVSQRARGMFQLHDGHFVGREHAFRLVAHLGQAFESNGIALAESLQLGGRFGGFGGQDNFNGFAHGVIRSQSWPSIASVP